LSATNPIPSDLGLGVKPATNYLMARLKNSFQEREFNEANFKSKAIPVTGRGGI
jgi:hypothetical protein